MRYPINIAYLIESIGAGGAERQLVELVSHLDPVRFAPRLLVWSTNDFFADSHYPANVPLYRCLRRSRLDLAPVYQAARWLRAGQVDIVHGYLNTGSLYAALAHKLARRGIAMATQRTSARALGLWQRYRKRWAHRQAAVTVANNER